MMMNRPTPTNSQTYTSPPSPQQSPISPPPLPQFQFPPSSPAWTPCSSSSKLAKPGNAPIPGEILHPPPSSGSSRGENTVGEGEGAVHYFGDIQTLGEALDPKFDGYYEGKGRVVWERCEEAYVRESEGVEYKGFDIGLEEAEGEYMWHEVATELD
jgi:hypothetical protein